MTQMNADQTNDPQTYAIIGAAFEVHRTLGHGFLEGVYQEAFAVELALRGLPINREVMLPVSYKGKVLSCFYKADFICYGEVLVELKAIEALAGPQRAQVINYLKITGLSRALLLNFGSERLQYERIVLTPRSLDHLRESAASAD